MGCYWNLQPTKFGARGTREQRTLSWKIHTNITNKEYYHGVSKKERKEWKRDKQWKLWVTLNSIVPISYKCSLVPLQIVDP